MTRSSAFDPLSPPSEEIMDQCVHCGFCLPVCPTYVLWREEMDSPRGRISLMKMASEGSATMNASWVGHFDTCLGCMACMTACPSGVDYGKLISATRAQITRGHERPTAERLYRRFVFGLFTRPDRLRALLFPLLAYQKAGLQALVRKTGLLRFLPTRIRTMEALLPRLERSRPLPERIPAQGERRHLVGLWLGCVQRVFFPEVNAATARVLAAEGCEVFVPDQPCCGALLVHAGEEKEAKALALQTIDAFEGSQCDAVIVNAAGCGSNLKDYGYFFRDDPQWAARATRFSARCKDVTEFLALLEPRAPRKPLRLRVAYHDACHLQHAQGIRAPPRSLLSAIPGVDLLELPEAPICCGSAGVFNLVQPAAAEELGDRKASLISELRPDLVVSGNPGCILQIRSALERRGEHIPVLHSVQLLDASIRGASPQTLLG